MPFLLRLSLVFLALACGPVSGALAAGLELIPFSTSNQNPLVAIYGLPPAGPATVLAAGRMSAELRADIASNYSDDNQTDDNILLDGETYRFTLALDLAVTEDIVVDSAADVVFHLALRKAF